MNVYSLFDKVAEEFGPVFEAKNDAVALRSVSKLFGPDGATVSDFQLFIVATFDRSSGQVYAYENIKEIPIVGVGPGVESLNLPEENK